MFDKVALGQAFPEHFDFPVSIIISPLLRIYLLSSGWKIGRSGSGFYFVTR
jgi:hypothetical protein